MRQKLPESAGAALIAGEIGLTIHPGDEFDADRLVPGCVPVDDTEDAPETDAGDGEGGEDEAAETLPGAQGKPRAKGTRS